MKAHLKLAFESSNGRTRLRIDAQEPPWRVIRAFQQENGPALVHLHNISGGVLAGDDLRLGIDVGPRACAQVTTTGATRLYRHRPGTPDSRQEITISVADGAILEYLPDALIPFAGSRHQQRTRIQMAEGATLFAWEVVAPGRQAMGEKFAFDRLSLSTRIESPFRPVLLEDFLLEPGVRPLFSRARLGDYTHTASFYAIQVGRSARDLRELEGQLAEIAVRESHIGCTIWGTSALAADGVIVKGLGATARHLSATLAGFWDTTRRFLTGDRAMPPRKLK